MARTPEDYTRELNALDAFHAQNEAGRDAFIALAHTALFAASISFVGDVAPLGDPLWRPALIAGWLSSVIGLVALTVSFGVARRTIDARREALNNDDPPGSTRLEQLNGVALWSFPVTLLCLFSFVTANVVNADVREIQSAATSSSELRPARGDSAPTSADIRRSIEALDGRGTGSARASASPATASAAAYPASEQEVGAAAAD